MISQHHYGRFLEWTAFSGRRTGCRMDRRLVGGVEYFVVPRYPNPEYTTLSDMETQLLSNPHTTISMFL